MGGKSNRKYRTYKEYLNKCNCYKYIIVTAYCTTVWVATALNQESADQLMEKHCNWKYAYRGILYTAVYVGIEKYTEEECFLNELQESRFRREKPPIFISSPTLGEALRQEKLL